MESYMNSKLIGTAAASTLAKRIRFLIELSEMFSNSKDFSFLNNTDKIIARINKSNNVDTQWNNLFHVIMAIRSDPSVVNNKSKLIYEQLADRLKIQREAKHLNNVKTEKQIKTLEKDLSFRQTQLSEKISELFQAHSIPYEIISNANLKKIEPYTFSRKLQDLVIAAVYLYQPAIRNNWGSLKITNKLKDLPNNNNYLYIRGQTMKLVMNVFKNSKSLGNKVIIIRPSLVYLLKIWLSLLKSVLGKVPEYPLYYNITSKKIEYMGNDEVLRRKIPRITERLFGVPMSINDFRHLWEIDIQTNPLYATYTLQQRRALHLELLHDTSIAQEYNVQD